ncbi:hypothetical protein [Silanimonas sp.]|uniref:hypothetical protein n=1 Tax=Silanimonas sp. TaxID=1929290 RepID=UPI0022C5A7E6|nr:hypothetical protein [Silanimonas sp.]MCZ8167040.1 hypothetical protein [Silanimonas sp.]
MPLPCRPSLFRVRPTLLAAAVLALTGCGPSPEEQRAAAEAAAAAREAAMAPTLQVYRDARARGDARIAVASAEVILADGPGTAAATEVSEGLDALREAAKTQVETERLEALWSYVSTPIAGESNPQKAASMRNRRPEADDPASFAVVPTVQLVLRNDPRWGQSVYLVIEEGVFECGRPCAFNITLDEAAPKRFAGEASSTGTRPALFIKDDAGFIRALDAASTVRIAPVDGRADPIDFEVGGFDIGRYQAGG